MLASTIATLAVGAASPGGDLHLGALAYARVERRANEHTKSSQEAVALDADPAGRAVLVWQSRRQEQATYGVYARRFDVDGTPITGEVHVNATEADQQTQPAVAVDPSGAWFAWVSLGQDGDQGSIVARRFDPALGRSSAEVLVNDGVVDGHQDAPDVASDADGTAVVVWATPGSGEGERWILARRLDASARPIGPAFRVDQSPGFRAALPCVARDAAGGFVVAWARARAGRGPDAGRPAGIHARRFDAAGEAIGGELAISPDDGRQHIEPAIASGADGSVAFAWFASRGEEFGPVLRIARASPGGFDLLPVRELEACTEGHASGLALARATDGRLVLAWSSYGDAERKADVHARLLRADGEPEPSVETFRVTEASSGNQALHPASSARHAVFLDDGRLAFAWSGDGGLGDANGAHLTLLAPEGLDLASIAPEPMPSAVFDGPRPEDHVPPTYDPLRAHDRAGAIEMSVGGPDYGFLGVVNTGWDPPDPHLAVGTSHVVLVTNGILQIMGKDGSFQFSQQLHGAAGFWGSLGAGTLVFDPEACYDPHSGRFLIAACERTGPQGFFLLAVSDDGNPNGTWFKYRFDVTALGGGAGDIDSPNLAVDAQAVYLCADFFTPSTRFLVYILQKAPLLSGGTPTTRSLLITGSQSFGVPVTYGTPPAQYMIESFEAATNTQIRLHAIRNPLTTPTDTTVTLTVPAYQLPEFPPQLGTTSRPVTFEPRFWSCVYRNGSLWATHHAGSSRVLQRWYEIDMGNWPTSGTPTIVQQGTIDPGPGIRTFFGSIWADADDNVGLVFARSSPTEFISMGRTFRRATDPPGTMTPMLIVKNSTSPELSQRWGDYSGVNSDPLAPGIFWGTHQFRTSTWMTWVDLFGPCDAPTQYCTAKMNSAGQLPFLTGSGEPSLGSNAFSVVLNNALPNKLGVAFYADAPDATPFAGGTRCVLPPLHRGGTFVTDAFGVGVIAHPITLGMVGNDRYFQLFSRDPQHPDGTGLSLSNGLRVVFCP